MRAVPDWSISCAVDDIQALIGPMAGVSMWTPGARYWAWALSQQESQILVCIDGALAIAQWYWPEHYVSDTTFDLNEIIYILAARLRLSRKGDSAYFPIALPGSQCGRCCVWSDRKGFPWVLPESSIIGGEGDSLWQVPPSPEPLPERRPHWGDAFGPAAANCQVFFDKLLIPKWILQVQGAVKEIALKHFLASAVAGERKRLAHFQIPTPGWLEDELEIERNISELFKRLSAPEQPIIRMPVRQFRPG